MARTKRNGKRRSTVGRAFRGTVAFFLAFVVVCVGAVLVMFSGSASPPNDGTTSSPGYAAVGYVSSGSGITADAVPAVYLDEFMAAAGRCPELSLPVFAAQIKQESGWNPKARSGVGALGLGQVMPATFRAYGVDADGDGTPDPYSPADSLATAAVYDCSVINSVKGVAGYSDDPVGYMLAGYNAGPGAVQKYSGIPPYSETKNYVRVIEAQALKYTPSAPISTIPGAGAVGGQPLSGWPLLANGLGPDTENIRQVVDTRFGTDTPVGNCIAQSGHVSDSYHYDGHACDVTIGKIGAYPGAADTAHGWEIANFLVANWQSLNIDEVIWQGQIWTRRRMNEGWRQYTGGYGVTKGHYDHVHFSANRDK